MYIISRCLLGDNCKYNGGNNLNEYVVKFCQSHSITGVCPETEGGLKSPRVPAERVRRDDGSFGVINRNGDDWTAAFVKGAEAALERAVRQAAEMGEQIEGAILKARSPSCGYGVIYDGSFTGTRCSGNGVFAEMLEKTCRESLARGEKIFAENLRIITEEEI